MYVRVAKVIFLVFIRTCFALGRNTFYEKFSKLTTMDLNMVCSTALKTITHIK